MDYVWSIYGVSSEEEHNKSGVSLKETPLFLDIKIQKREYDRNAI